jgi:hypothetical protein
VRQHDRPPVARADEARVGPDRDVVDQAAKMLGDASQPDFE